MYDRNSNVSFSLSLCLACYEPLPSSHQFTAGWTPEDVNGAIVRRARAATIGAVHRNLPTVHVLRAHASPPYPHHTHEPRQHVYSAAAEYASWATRSLPRSSRMSESWHESSIVPSVMSLCAKALCASSRTPPFISSPPLRVRHRVRHCYRDATVRREGNRRPYGVRLSQAERNYGQTAAGREGGSEEDNAEAMQ